ncbi:23S rRNA (guanosine(2251)-2'-O)-methyltransferase RlmB [Bacillus horti]|uniref:23S rRNA (Guanosine2251-2'-O)-methyltransferase n=1 Tax=Caldalkalibacillus horti TaxID=77523 RepID=A0ABT9VYH4_9BACI|nr:23S rRNA (guanosine(2251)-2'-O)-methyltransferase RlmB [Bacillus horti]MDQ0166045.1 23S rRNA (guanosine2251-2'-O)-methyltransferase [Bacillus horti]
MSEEWIGGKNPILEALRAERPINKIWVAENSVQGAMKELLQLAKAQNIVVQNAPKKKLDQLAGEITHQGVLASVAAYEYAEIDDLFARAKEKNEDPFFLILDEIEDPHNLGSILRTADATGVHGVIIPKRRAVGLTATVAKASAGAIEYVPVARVTNIAQTIDELKDRGVWIAGTDAQGKEDYRQATFGLPIALVIGSEGKGIGRLILKKCDFTIQLPLVGHVNSLNASVAASVLMYEVFRRRNPVA